MGLESGSAFVNHFELMNVFIWIALCCST